MQGEEENIWLICFQREEYWCGMGSCMGIGKRSHIPLHSITTFNQRCKTWPKNFTPTSTLPSGCSFTCSPMPTPDQCSTSSVGVSWSRGSSVWGEESRIRERDFGNFEVEGRMNVIKEIRRRFRRFFYQEVNFNFSHFRMKLKFHIFSCLKFFLKF